MEKDADYTGDNYEKFKPSNQISYKDLIVVGQLHGSKPMIVVLKNCFNEAGFSLETSDSNEGTYALNAYANYTYDPIKDAAGTTEIPMEIYLPKPGGGVSVVSVESLPDAENSESNA